MAVSFILSQNQSRLHCIVCGEEGLSPAEFPPTETPLIEGEVAFRQHAVGHTNGPNWPTFLLFAERYLSRSQTTR